MRIRVPSIEVKCVVIFQNVEIDVPDDVVSQGHESVKNWISQATGAVDQATVENTVTSSVISVLHVEL